MVAHHVLAPHLSLIIGGYTLATWLTEKVSNLEVERHDFDPTTALVLRDYEFGRQVRSYLYNGDGTVDTLKDAAGKATRLLNYRRGKPQLVQMADGNVESQVINNLGKPDSRTNAAGTTTGYAYDTMGRVSRVTYPTGDGAAYYPTEQFFEPVNSVEYGLAPGHWRQTITTGNILNYGPGQQPIMSLEKRQPGHNRLE